MKDFRETSYMQRFRLNDRESEAKLGWRHLTWPAPDRLCACTSSSYNSSAWKLERLWLEIVRLKT